MEKRNIPEIMQELVDTANATELTQCAVAIIAGIMQDTGRNGYSAEGVTSQGTIQVVARYIQPVKCGKVN